MVEITNAEIIGWLEHMAESRVNKKKKRKYQQAADRIAELEQELTEERNRHIGLIHSNKELADLNCDWSGKNAELEAEVERLRKIVKGEFSVVFEHDIPDADELEALLRSEQEGE